MDEFTGLMAVGTGWVAILFPVLIIDDTQFDNVCTTDRRRNRKLYNDAGTFVV